MNMTFRAVHADERLTAQLERMTKRGVKRAREGRRE